MAAESSLDPNKDRNDLVVLMIRLHARACTISDLTDTPINRVRSEWRRLNGANSPSGQLPSDLDWFLKNPDKRAYGALILALLNKCMDTMDFPHAFAHAYYHFARMTADPATRLHWVDGDPAFRSKEKDYVVNFSRAFTLACAYTKQPDAVPCNVDVRACRTCNAHFLHAADETSRICRICELSRNARRKI